MIELNDISKGFKNDEIINNVSLSLKYGNVYGFVGRNGCGKSVLFKIICGFMKPDNGTIIINGIDIYSEKVFPNDIAALIEKPRFLDNLSGYENLKLLAKIKNKITDVVIINMLKDFELLKDKDKNYKDYSLGMKQKLGIIQALMEDEKIIILDEPFSSLDDKTVKKVRDLLLREKEKGKIIIISSHIKEDIEILCDIIYRIDSGKISKVDKI